MRSQELPGQLALDHGLRATRAIIDLDAIAGNVRAMRSILPASAQMLAVVKADAYGHGAPWVARVALESGATALGVATVGEGRALRREGIRAPILVLGAIDSEEAAGARNLGLEITVAEATLLTAVQEAARCGRTEGQTRVHLKIDTGMRRYGVAPEEAVALAKQIARDPYLALAGVCTHFASADEPDEAFTDEQLERFRQAVAAIRNAGVQPEALHAANSAGVLTARGVAFDLVRPGIALYGVPPSADVPLLPGMRPAMRVESRITRVIPLAPGDTVGYNRTYRATSATRGALIPIGYADGYRRSLSGRGWVGLHGGKAPILGRVSMDQTVVGVPEECVVEAGDMVQVFGGDPEQCGPSVADVAELMGTNAYEVLVGIRRRIPRVFVRGGEVVGVRDAD